MTEAVRQASLLEAALRKATTDKGISFYTLNQELVKAGTSAEQLVSTLGSAGPEFADSFNVALQALATADRSVISISSKFAEMRRVLTQSIKFTAAAQLQDAFVTAISECIRWVEDLNESLTMISVVTGKTASEMDGVYDSVIEGSKALRVAASDYAEASLIFYQQGLDDQEVQRRTDITIKAAQAAGSSTQEMSKQLTAVWNTFQMVGDEQERAASVGAKLAADTAVDFKDIAEGMQISATAAAQMGVSYDSLAAIIATVGDTTQQSASVIGNAYKTIFSRFQQLKVEGTDGEVTLNRVSQQLQDVGIHVLDSAGNLRELDDVIMEVGMQWDNYTEKQQLAIAEVVGGTRQYGQFLALMQNFDKYVELLGTAQSEDGSALEQQYQAAQDSIEMAAVNAGEAWNRAFGEVIDEDLIKGFYHALEDVGNVVTDILDGMGGFEGILTLVGTLLARNIVPKLEQAVVAVKTMRANSTIEGRQAQVVASGQQMRQDIADQAESDISKASGRQRYQIQFNADSAGLKVDTWTAIGKAQQQVNAMINSGNESLKIQGQYLADQLKKYGEIGNQGAENLATARMELQEESQQTEELLEQIKLQQQLLSMNPQAVSEEAGDRIAEKEMTKSDNTLKIGDIDAQRAGIQAQIQSTLANTTLDATKVNEVINALRQQDAVLAAQRNSLVQINNEIDKEIANIREADQAAVAQEKQVTEIQKAFLEVAQAAAKARTSSEGAVSSSDINKMKRSMRDALTSNGFSLSNDGDKKIIGGIVKEFDGLANSGEIAASLEKIRAKVEAALGGKNISTEGYQNVIRALDQIDQAATGVSGITNNLSATLNQANIAAQKVSGSMTQIAFGFTGIATAASSGWSAALEGNFLGVASALGSIGMQLPQTIQAFKDLAMASKAAAVAQELTRVASDKASASTLTQGVAYSALTAEQKKAYIQEQLLAMAKKLNIQGCEQMTAAQLKQAISQKGLTVSVSQTTGAVAANAAAWYAHPLTWILAAVMAVVAAFTIWNKVIEMNTKAAEEDVERCQEQVDKYEELSTAITENTTAVEENIAAYREAINAGQDASDAYSSMVDSLDDLNESLIEAGANQENLSRAMNMALATGNMDLYYDEVDKAQTDIYNKQMENYSKLNEAQIKLAKNQMTKAFDFNGPEKTMIASTITDSQTGQVIMEPSEALKEVAEKYDILEADGLDVELNLEFDDVTTFREQYQDLIKIKEELEDQGAAQNEINAIQDQIDGLTESYNALEENIQAAADAMEDMVTSSIENSGYDFSGIDFKDSADYMNQVYAYVEQQGRALGMTAEEIETSFRSIIASIPELNSDLASLDQASQVMQQIAAKQNSAIKKIGKDGSEQTVTVAENLSHIQEQMEELEKIEGMSTSGTGFLWLFDSEQEQAMKEKGIEDLAVYREQLEQEAEKIEKEAEDLRNRIMDKFNNMTDEDREILLKTGIEFVDEEGDLQQILDNYKDLHVRIKADIRTEEELQAQIESDNALQGGLETAISEFNESGMVSVDTAKEMIDAGLGEYLMVVNDHFVLTTAAANAYNTSLETEKDAVQELLKGTTDLSQPLTSFAETLAATSATLDDEGGLFGDLITYMEDLSVEAINGEITMSEYFDGITTKVKETIPQIQESLDSLSDEQLQQVVQSLGEIGVMASNVMSQANNAFSRGEMNVQEYRETLRSSGEAAYESAQAAAEINQEKIYDKREELSSGLGMAGTGNANAYDSYIESQREANDAARESEEISEEAYKARAKELDQYQEEADILRDLEKDQSDLNKTTEDYKDQLSDFDAMDDYVDAMTEYGDMTESLFNEDFSLKLDPQLEMDPQQLEAASGILQGALSSMNQIVGEEFYNMTANSDEQIEYLMSRFNFASEQEARACAQLLNTYGNYTQEQLQAALTAGEITQAEYDTLIQTAQGKTSDTISSMSQAVGTMIEGIGEIISNFDYNIDVTVTGNLSLKPTWGSIFDLGWKLLSGQTATVEPDGELNFGITGTPGEGSDMSSGLAKIQEAANFMKTNPVGDSIKPSNYTTKEPTAAVPEDFDVPEGTTNNGKTKTGGSERTPKDTIEEEDYEKFHERYEDLTLEIERLTDTLDEYSEAADNAWGAEKVQAMKRYNKQIQAIGRSQKELINSTKEYYGEDKDAFLAAVSPDIAAIAQFSGGEYGVLENPELIRRELEKKAAQAANDYNKMILAYNQGQISEEAMNNAEDNYNKTIDDLNKQNELLNQLLDTENLLRERINDQVENIRNWLQNKIDEIEYKLEFKIDISEYEIEQLDRLIDRMGNLGLIDGQSFKAQGQIFSEYMGQIDDTMTAVAEARQKLSNLNAPENQAWFKETFGDEAWDEFLSSGGRLPDSVMSFLEEQKSSVMDGIDHLYETARTTFEMLIEEINLLFDEYEKLANDLEGRMNRLDTLETVLEYQGDPYSTAEGRESLRQINEARRSTAVTEGKRLQSLVKSRQKEVDALESQANKAFEEYKYYRDIGDEEMMQGAADAYNQIAAERDAAKEELLSAEADLQSQIQEIISIAQETWDDELQSLGKELVDSLGGMFTDLSELSEMYSTEFDNLHYYLDDYDKNYELDTLQRNVDEFLEDQTDPEILENIALLQEHINEYRQDGVDITSQEVEILNQALEVEKARAAFEDARNAKNTMRLARDASGNWNYVYSNSDTAAENDAAQGLADAEYEYKKLYEQFMNDTEQASAEAIEQLKETIDQYDEYLYQNNESFRKWYDENIRIALDNLNKYTDSSERATEILEDGIIDYQYVFHDNALGIISDTEDLRSFMEKYTQAMVGGGYDAEGGAGSGTAGGYLGQIMSKQNELRKQTGEDLDAMGINWDDLQEQIEEETGLIIEDNEDTADAVEDLEERSSIALENFETSIDSWRTNFLKSLDEAIQKIQEFLDWMKQMEGQQNAGFTADFGTDYTDYVGTTYAEAAKQGITPDEWIAQNKDWFDQQAAEMYYVSENDPDRGSYYQKWDSLEDAMDALTDTLWTIYNDADNEDAYWNNDNWDFNAGKHGGSTKTHAATGGLFEKETVTGIAEDGPELVLNKEDTKNILEAVRNMREIVKIKIQGLGNDLKKRTTGVTEKTTITKETKEISQDVHIEASFPNVSVAAEIEEAFNNLVNQAVQYQLKD